jgi:hypothetical protein
MGLDTKTYWLTDRQSQCDFDFDLWVSSAWKPVNSAGELQLKGACQRGQEQLDMEAEDATLLEAATKQRSENHEWEH